MPEKAAESHYFSNAVAQLSTGRNMRTYRAVIGANGMKILDKGVQITPGLYERLMQHHPATPLQDVMEIEGAVSASSLRAAGEEVLHSNPVLARMSEEPATRKLLLDCLEAVPLPPAVAFQLTVVRDVHPGQFSYFVATSLTAVWLGNRPKVMRNDLVMLAAAGLLHDLGMMHVDPVLLKPSTKIHREQRRQLYSHPLVSVLLLECHKEYRADMLRAVREHHEALDGSGYPAGLTDAAIGAGGRIVALSQLVASAAGRGSRQALLRLSVLLRTNRHRYDGTLIDRLLPLLHTRAGVDTDATDAIDNPVADPLRHLHAIYHALQGWPSALAQDTRWSAVRRSGLEFMGLRCARIHRTVNESGVAPEQLQSLDAGAIAGPLADELSLITRELAWQLRAVEREARRRWAATADEPLPESLAGWFTEVETVCFDLVDRRDLSAVEAGKI